MRIFLLLHLLGAIVWLGGMFTMLYVVRPTVTEHLQQPADRLGFMLKGTGRFLKIVWFAMPLTLLTGFAMLGLVGFSRMSPGVHIMLTLGLLMGVIFLVIWFGPFKKFRSAMASSDFPVAAKAHENVRKLVLTNMTIGFLSVILVALT